MIYYQDKSKNITLYHVDCLELLPTLKEKFNTVLIDPPYYKTVKAAWDNQWPTVGDFVGWLESVVIQLKPLMYSNSSFYMFQDSRWAAYTQIMLDKHLTYLNNMVWHKTDNGNHRFSHNARRYCKATERILFYTPELSRTGLGTIKLDVNNFAELRKYFYDMLCFMGLNSSKGVNKVLGHRKAEHAFYVTPKPMTKSEVINTVGQKADHCFRYGSTQWELPTVETYNELIAIFGIDKWSGFIPYEESRLEYEGLRLKYEESRLEYESQRRYFRATNSTFDLISGAGVTGDTTAHETTKPQWLIRQLLTDSTRQGGMVLDCFAGSGSTLLACQALGFGAIGIEKDKSYCELITKRLLADRQKAGESIPQLENVKQLGLF